MKKLIGILGGMGPMASADMFLKFIQSANVQKDQDHIPLLISSIPNIPDRSAHLLQGGADPYPYLFDYTDNLVKAGATCIVIACNTAHYWFDKLQSAFPHIHFISMIHTASEFAKNSGHQHIGILATNATLSTHLYKTQIENLGLHYLEPDNNTKVMESIYLYKAGQVDKATALMQVEQAKLFDKGANVIILGCTEVPLILAQDLKNSPSRYIDATQVLVDKAIAWYREV